MMSCHRSGVCVLLLLAGSVGLADAQEPQQVLRHAILVHVNDKKITQQDLNEMGEFLFERFYPHSNIAELPPHEHEILSDTAMRELILIHLVNRESRRLTDAYEEEDNPRKKMRMTKVEASYEDVLKRMRNVGIDPVRAPKIARTYYRSQVLMDKILIARGHVINQPSPRQIREYWKAHKHDQFITKRHVKVRHIFLDAKIEDRKAVKKRLQIIREPLEKKSGEALSQSFAKAAREFSQGPFRANGGLIELGPGGWMIQGFEYKNKEGHSLFPKDVIEGIDKMRVVGELSPIVSSERGFHLFLLEDAKGGEQIPFSKAQTMIERYLQQSKRTKIMRAWLKGTLETSNILWHDGTRFPKEEVLPPEVQMGDVVNELAN